MKKRKAFAFSSIVTKKNDTKFNSAHGNFLKTSIRQRHFTKIIKLRKLCEVLRTFAILSIELGKGKKRN